MQDLQELAYIIKNHQNRKVDLFATLTGEDSLLYQFYTGIVNQGLKDDDAASQHLYNNSIQANKYQKLKSNFRQQLINSLFLIDFKRSAKTERQKAYYECNKEMAAMKILLGKNARTASVSLCHKIIKQSLKFEFTELSLEVARTLRLHYGAREGNLKKYEAYDRIFKEQESIYVMENEAEGLYTDLVIRYVKFKATNEEIQRKAISAYEVLKPYMAKCDSYRLHLCGNLIRIMIFTTVNDYQEAAKACEDAVAFFEKKNYSASVPLQIWYFQLLVCYTQLKKFDAGRAIASKCEELLEEGNFNWFKFQELNFILSMHTAQYQIAYDTFLKAVDHKRFKYLPESVRELWKIFEAYVHYLIKIKRIQPSENDKRFNNFRLGRFLNDTPIYSKDKRGMNIPILVIQILFMILHRKYADAIDRIEAIEKYCSRYLRKNDTFRSNCFIKMLLLIPAAGFHKAGIALKAKKYKEKINSVSLDVANQAHEIEIIPYEDLWDLAQESLENRFYKHKSKQRKAATKRELV